MKRASKTPGQRAEYENHFDLGALFEFSRTINSAHDLEFILSHLLLTLMGKLLSLRGIVLLRKDEGIFVVGKTKGMPQDLSALELAVDQVPRRTIYLSGEDLRRLAWGRTLRTHGLEIIVPLMAQDRVLGIMGFSPSLKHKRLQKKEEEYIKSLANIAAGAIERGLVVSELRQVNRRLDGKVHDLHTLLEVSKEFNIILDEERLVKSLMFSVMGHLGATKYFLSLDHHGEMRIAASRLDGAPEPALLGQLIRRNSPLLASELTSGSDRKLGTLLAECGIQLVVPLSMRQEVKGILGVGPRMRGEPYTKADLDFVTSLAYLASISLENARLFREAIEKQRLEDDLLIAREIQRGLLPLILPDIPHFGLSAVNISSRQVGGDYYDVVALGGDRYMLAIGDVSGKGTPASLLMANLQATIRALISPDASLAELTGRVNDLLCDNTTSGRFITFFWGILDAQRRSLRYVSGGHNPPYLLHAGGSVERLEAGGLILGVLKTTIPYDEGEAHFGPGDVLLMFTDGVSEAMSSKGEEFGEERLEECLRSAAGDGAESIISRVVEEVRRHSADAPQSDDITLLVLKAE